MATSAQNAIKDIATTQGRKAAYEALSNSPIGFDLWDSAVEVANGQEAVTAEFVKLVNEWIDEAIAA